MYYRYPGTAVAGLVLAVATSGVARSDHPAAPGAAPADTARFLRHAIPIGNLGSITPNARRYAFNATWTLLAAPQDNGSVRLFDVANGTPLAPLEGGFKVGTFTYAYSDRRPEAYFGFGSDGSSLVWSWGKKVVVWDVASGKILEKQEVPGSSWGVGFNLFSGLDLRQKVVTAWPAPAGSGAGNSAESPDGRLVAFVNGNDDVEIHDRRDASLPRVLPGREKGNHGRCAVFDNGRRGPQLLFSRDGRILCDSCRVTDVWDLGEANPKLVVRTGLLRDTAGRPVLSPDGRTLAYSWGKGSSLQGDGGFGLLDVATARPVGPLVEVKYMGAMEFSPDSTHLATVGWVPRRGSKKDFEVQIWSVDGLRSVAPAEERNAVTILPPGGKNNVPLVESDEMLGRCRQDAERQHACEARARRLGSEAREIEMELGLLRAPKWPPPPQEQAATEAERIAALERALLPVKAAAEAEAAEYRRLCPPPSPLTPSAIDPCLQASMGTLSAGTEVVVLKRTAGSPLVQIKVVTGKLSGKVGWVEEEHLSK